MTRYPSWKSYWSSMRQRCGKPEANLRIALKVGALLRSKGLLQAIYLRKHKIQHPAAERRDCRVRLLLAGRN
jgi:hypothetical protein